MNNFWQKLTKPFTILAPMDDVTDVVFREIVAQTAPPDVFFTEFVNCEAIFSSGKESQIKRFEFTKRQHPIVGQIWGLQPENFYKAAQLVKSLGLDGVDINMGCPDRKVVRYGSCSALIKNHSLAKEIISAVKNGAGEGLPVSIKTRLGFDKIETEKWLGFLLTLNLDALTVHGRTVKEMSKVPAHWDEIGKVVSLRNQMKVNTQIIGNGDVKSYAEAVEKSSIYGVDGVMIGRGIFEDLTVFSKKGYKSLSKLDRLNLLLEHIRLFDCVWGQNKNFQLLKKYVKIYVSGFDGAVAIRAKMMEADSLGELTDITREFQRKLS